MRFSFWPSPANSWSDTLALSKHAEETGWYSIWFADRELPNGWREAGKQGLKAECLDYIEDVWTDMRPLSLRKAMDAQKN